MVVEVVQCVWGVSSLPMGIGRVDKHEGESLQTWKGSDPTIIALDLGSARLLERRNLR